MRYIYVVIILFIAIFTVEGQIKFGVENPSTYNNEAVYKKYIEMDEYLKKSFNNAVRSFLPHIMKANEHINISSQCKTNILRLFSDLRKLKLSAVKFLDAIAKPSEGLLMGKMVFLGDYEECLTTTFQNRNGDVAFRGQYCIMGIKTALPTIYKSLTLNKGDKNLKAATLNASEFMQFVASKVHALHFRFMHFGICVPTGCSTDDINQSAGYFGRTVDLDARVFECYYEGKHPRFTTGTIIAIALFLFLGLLLLISTFVEYICKKRNILVKSLGVRLLLCFSLMTNFPKLINTKSVKTSDRELLCLYGIRCLSFFYTILSHQYLLILATFNIAHVFKYFDEIENYFFQVIPSAIFTTDNFFLLAGLVNCYSRMKVNEISKRNISKFKLLFLRIWRLYPALMFVIYFAPKFLSTAYGPTKEAANEVLRNCNSYWWRNMLFISNFFDVTEACMSQTWYVCADMQIFVLTLFTIPVLIKKPAKGILLHVGLILTGIISCSIWVWYKNIAPAIIVTHPTVEGVRDFNNLYNSPVPHIAPYCTGIILGYFLHKKKDFKLSQVVQFIGWFASILFFTCMLLISQRWNSGVEYSVVEAMLYFPLSRFLYTAAVGWMILCCVTGHGGVINYILSLSIWIPVSRLAYMGFLISVVLQAFYFGNSRVTIDNHRMVIIWQHLGDIMITCLMSTVLVLLVESPFIAMQKMLFRRPSKEVTTKGNDNPAFVKEIEKSVISENYKNGNVIATARL